MSLDQKESLRISTGNTTEKYSEISNIPPYEDPAFKYFSISVLCLEAAVGAFLNILTITSRHFTLARHGAQLRNF